MKQALVQKPYMHTLVSRSVQLKGDHLLAPRYLNPEQLHVVAWHTLSIGLSYTVLTLLSILVQFSYEFT